MFGREVQYSDTGITLYMKGLLSWFAVKRKLVMPYHTIKNVLVDEFDPPRWMLRMPGTSISALYIYEGSFKYANEWYFLSFERREPLVHIELEGHEQYKYVIFQTDNPTETASNIRRRLASLRG